MGQHEYDPNMIILNPYPQKTCWVRVVSNFASPNGNERGVPVFLSQLLATFFFFFLIDKRHFVGITNRSYSLLSPSKGKLDFTRLKSVECVYYGTRLWLLTVAVASLTGKLSFCYNFKIVVLASLHILFFACY